MLHPVSLSLAALAFVTTTARAADPPVAEPVPAAAGSEVVIPNVPSAPVLHDTPPAAVEQPPAIVTPAVTPPAVPVPAAEPVVEAKPTPAAFVAGYKDGFFIATGDELNKLKVRALLQPRLTFEGGDRKVLANNKLAFAVQRAQLELGGNVFSKALSFQLKLEGGQGFFFVKDAFVNSEFIPGAVSVRAGQFKRPFNRQEVTSDWKQEFVDRSITNAFFGGGRDIGVMVHNDYEKSPTLEYAAGVFDGSSDKPKVSGVAVVDTTTGLGTLDEVKLSNVPALLTPTLVARVGYNYGDVKGYTEADIDGGELRFGVAGSVLEGVALGDKPAGLSRAQLDAIVKIMHVDASAAVFVSAKQNGKGSFDQALEAIGAHAQVGMVLAEMFHPALRYDFIAVDGDDNDLHEIVLGNSLMFFGQNAQLQTDGGVLLTQDPSGLNPALRLRVQLVFAM